MECCALVGTNYRSTTDAPPGIRPQLKREPLGVRPASTYPQMTPQAALALVRRHGVVLEGARGSVPTLAEAVVGERIHGSWWGHTKGQEIFRLTRAVRDSGDVLVCRLVGHKITYVHRRLWPALVRLADDFARDDLAALHEIHTSGGRHELRVVPFPRWVSPTLRRQARKLTEPEARAALGDAWATRRKGRRLTSA
jgi:hypothetical protein